MIKLVSCNEITDKVIFDTFMEGFSDYHLKVEMTQEFFFDRFFGAEGNSRNISFLAFDDEVPVGLLLSGIRVFDGIKTMRCCGMSVIPSARKKGIAKLMMAQHEAIAKKENVHQMLLEVLTVNEQAYKFYERLGYEKVYDLTYRTFTPSANWLIDKPESCLKNKEVFYSIQKITLTDLSGLRHIDESHLPWQGTIEYVSMLPVEVYGVFKNGQLIAGLIGSDKKLFYLYVSPDHRLEGVGKALLMTYVQEMKVETCQFVYTNNARLHTFSNHINMGTDSYSQYEYYKWLE